MIEKIFLKLSNESGDWIALEKTNDAQIEIKIDTTIADLFSAICSRNHSLSDVEMKNAEKFRFALNLKEYLEDIKRNES